MSKRKYPMRIVQVWSHRHSFSPDEGNPTFLQSLSARFLSLYCNANHKILKENNSAFRRYLTTPYFQSSSWAEHCLGDLILIENFGPKVWFYKVSTKRQIFLIHELHNLKNHTRKKASGKLRLWKLVPSVTSVTKTCIIHRVTSIHKSCL